MVELTFPGSLSQYAGGDPALRVRFMGSFRAGDGRHRGQSDQDKSKQRWANPRLIVSRNRDGRKSHGMFPENSVMRTTPCKHTVVKLYLPGSARILNYKPIKQIFGESGIGVVPFTT